MGLFSRAAPAAPVVYDDPDFVVDVGDTFEGLPVSRQTRKLLMTPEGQRAWRKPYVPDSPEEKQMLRILDTRLMAMAWLMYVLNYIDRTNIGNAKVGGMARDLQLDSNGYSVALLIFFVGYLLAEIPSNLILTRTRPSIFLPTVMLVWGLLTIAFRGIESSGGLIGLRFVLGIVESGFFPGMLFTMSAWYKPTETAKRFAAFYSASILSGAFGGLIAAAVIKGLDGRAGVPGWKWLFVIEGCCTIGVSLVAYFVLPDYPSDTRFLTIEQRVLATKRILIDSAKAGHVDRDMGHKEALWQAVKDWRTWVLTVSYMGIAGAGTLSYFIPSIVGTLGHTGTDAQLWSAIPYAAAFCVSLAGNVSSDYFREKAFHSAGFMAFAAIMAIVQATVPPPKAGFALLCMVAIGIWTALPLFLSYAAFVLRNPPEKRAVAIAIINSLGNASSIYGAFLWPERTAPHYQMGWWVTSGLAWSAVIGILLMRWTQGPMIVVSDANDAEQIEQQLHTAAVQRSQQVSASDDSDLRKEDKTDPLAMKTQDA